MTRNINNACKKKLDTPVMGATLRFMFPTALENDWAHVPYSPDLNKRFIANGYLGYQTYYQIIWCLQNVIKNFTRCCCFHQKFYLLFHASLISFTPRLHLQYQYAVDIF